MSRPLAAAFLAAAIASGCVAGPQVAHEHAAASPSLPCASTAACDAAWSRTQAWIGQHSTWRVRLANDTLIETFGPSKLDGGALAYQATRSRNADGSGSVRVSTACYWSIPEAACTQEPATAIELLSYEITGR